MNYNIILDRQNKILDWFPDESTPSLIPGLKKLPRDTLPHRSLLNYEGTIWMPIFWHFIDGYLTGILYANWAKQKYLAWRLAENTKQEFDTLICASEYLSADPKAQALKARADKDLTS